jgi:hypothetical protein
MFRVVLNDLMIFATKWFTTTICLKHYNSCDNFQELEVMTEMIDKEAATGAAATRGDFCAPQPKPLPVLGRWRQCRLRIVAIIFVANYSESSRFCAICFRIITHDISLLFNRAQAFASMRRSAPVPFQ